jgi:hypothetical protein
MFFQYFYTVTLAMMMIERMVGQINQRQYRIISIDREYLETDNRKTFKIQLLNASACQSNRVYLNYKLASSTILRGV